MCYSGCFDETRQGKAMCYDCLCFAVSHTEKAKLDHEATNFSLASGLILRNSLVSSYFNLPQPCREILPLRRYDEGMHSLITCTWLCCGKLLEQNTFRGQQQYLTTTLKVKDPTGMPAEMQIPGQSRYCRKPVLSIILKLLICSVFCSTCFVTLKPV